MRLFRSSAAAALLAAAFTASVVDLSAGVPRPEDANPRVLKIGLAITLFRGQDNAAAVAQAQPLGELFATSGGVKPQFVVGDSQEIAHRLQQGDLHLAVVQGVEYAWLKAGNADVQPMVLAANPAVRQKALLLVRGDSAAKEVTDLKGRTLAVPRLLPCHCQLFLQHALAQAGQTPTGFFSATATPCNVDQAVDAVVDETAAAVLLDGLSWEVYRQRKPGRANKLRTLAESVWFPAPAILYKPGVLSDQETRQLREGFLTVHEKPFGRQMLLFWRLTQFVPVTAEYEDMVREIVKVFPQPMVPVQCITAIGARH